ncbi:MAG: transglutaminase domain-containing protein [Planctomycetes bacterium]|nr:transglutaminase domain-containing protein [Planctomycetota bacterium]
MRLLSRAILLILLALARPAIADTDRWYIVEMFGKRAGHMHAFEKEADGKITSSSSVLFEMKRGDVGVSISMSGEFVETTDGKPISMKSIQKMGQTEVVQEYTFSDTGVAVKTSQSGQVTNATKPRPEGIWLTPAAADKYVVQRFKSGAKEIVVRSIDPTSGLKIETTTHTIGDKAVIEAMGKKIEATKCATVSSAAPGVTSTEYLDPEGVMVRTETMMGGMSMLMVAATREEALGKIEDAAPEVFVKTFVKPDRPIEHARTLQHAAFIVSVPDGDLPNFPDTGAQKVERLSPTAAKLTINAAASVPAPKPDAADKALLASTTAVNTGDDMIKDLAARAVKGLKPDATAAEKAEACRKFTYRYIKKKNLGVGMGTATEVARTREGDCTEHGVFLVALLRANGIPARAASGLIYADAFVGQEAIFGYHMWAQALLEIDGAPRWIDLDGTLNETPFDATHICLAYSDLNDDDGFKSMISIAQVLGRLQIKSDEKP